MKTQINLRSGRFRDGHMPSLPGVPWRQFLPGGDGLRRAPECVTTNSPEYAALEGLKHRDSPQYVTKKN